MVVVVAVAEVVFGREVVVWICVVSGLVVITTVLVSIGSVSVAMVGSFSVCAVVT